MSNASISQNLSDTTLDTPKKKRFGNLGWKIGSSLSYIVMSLFALMTVYPIFWLILNSFKSTPEFMQNRLGLPQVWTTDNYPGAWVIGDFDKLIFNSIFYTVIATAGIIVFSVMVGFAFAKIPSKATKPIYNIFLLGILITLTSLMIPLYIVFFQVGLYNTHIGVLICYIGAGLSVGVYLCTEFIKGIPTALVEASRIDGASYFRIFGQIILPMTAPVIMTIAILNVVGVWNEFALINILVSDTNVKSLPLGIMRFSGTLSSDWGKQFAALVIGMAPMLIFYLIFRKQITQGVAGGAIKE